eukprot:2050246-Karenia_brevis.AAC.1
MSFCGPGQTLNVPFHHNFRFFTYCGCDVTTHLPNPRISHESDCRIPWTWVSLVRLDPLQKVLPVLIDRVVVHRT